MKCANTIATAILAASMVGSAQAATIEAGDVNLGTGIGGPMTFTSDGDLAIKDEKGVKGLGVQQQTNGEIDIGEDNAISMSRTDGDSFGLTSTKLAFLYDGPEYGDVQEVATITGELANGSLSQVRVENTYSSSSDTDFDLYVDGTLNNSLITNTYPSTINTAGLVDLGAIFGSQNLTALTFSAAPGTCGDGPCTNQSDYSIASVTTSAASVPEPATLGLLGMGLLGFGLRRSKR